MRKGLGWLVFPLLLMLGLAHAQSGKVTYVYTDPQGTPLAEADANGNITATFDYRPYGSQALGSPPAGPGYTGHINDPEIGLVYMQARYYDPQAVRFLSVDPIAVGEGDVFGFNRYDYAQNNPIMHIDPDGRQSAMDAGVWTNEYVMSQQGPNQLDQLNGMNQTQLTAVGLLANLDGAGEVVTLVRGAFLKAGMKDAAELSPEAIRGIKSLQKRIQEHLDKLAEFKRNPTVRPGMEHMSEEAIKKQQNSRIAHLEKEIQTFKNNIEKLRQPPPPPPPPPPRTPTN